MTHWRVTQFVQHKHECRQIGKEIIGLENCIKITWMFDGLNDTYQITILKNMCPQREFPPRWRTVQEPQ